MNLHINSIQPSQPHKFQLFRPRLGKCPKIVKRSRNIPELFTVFQKNVPVKVDFKFSHRLKIEKFVTLCHFSDKIRKFFYDNQIILHQQLGEQNYQKIQKFTFDFMQSETKIMSSEKKETESLPVRNLNRICIAKPARVSSTSFLTNRSLLTTSND